MQAWFNDVRYSVRALRANAGFAFAAVLTLSVAIGATTGVFSVVDATLLRPLPFDPHARIVAVGSTSAESPSRLETLSIEELHEWQRESQTMTALAGWRDWGMSRYDAGKRESVYGIVATPELFQVFPVQPEVGRLFTKEDDRPGRNAVVLITDAYWRERFGADPLVLGRTMELERGPKTTYAIVGVLPPSFNDVTAFERVKVVAPSSIDPDEGAGRAIRNRQAFGRLRDGVSLGEARAEMAVLAARLEQQFAGTNAGRGARVAPLVDVEVGPIAGTLRTFLFAVGLVLLVACANVAGLQLVRALARRREFSIRQALGGSRAVIVRALVAESVVLAVIAGAVGLFVARWLVDLTLASGPPIPRAANLQFDVRVFAFTFAICVGSALILALPATLLATKLDVSGTLKEQSNTVAGGALRVRLAFVAGQVTLALMLLSGAVLAGQTLMRQLTIRPGFDPDGLAAVQLFLPQESYPRGEQVAALYERIREEAAGVPGVQAVAAVSATPLSGEGAEPVTFRVAELRPAERSGRANSFNVTAGYFRALNARLVRGRDFAATDTAGGPRVAVVNETFVRRYLTGREPVGARIRLEPDGTVVEIVGVAADVLQDVAPRSVPEPEIYWPYSQQPRWATIVMLRSDNPGAAVAAVEQRITDIDSQIMTATPFLIADRIAGSARAPRFVSILFAMFSSLALLLSGIGVSGVVFYTFTRRTKEIALRVTLGATRRDVLRLVGGGAFAAVAAGSLAGLAGTLLLARTMGAALVELQPLRAADVLAAWSIIVVLGALACYLPARRALRIEPAEALRLD